MSLVYGLITGIIFGFLLQKAQVLKYDNQIGALRFLDMTIVKFMLSAIVVAAIYSYVKTHIISIGNYGKISVPHIIGINHWIVVIVFAVLALVLFRFFEKIKL